MDISCDVVDMTTDVGPLCTGFLGNSEKGNIKIDTSYTLTRGVSLSTRDTVQVLLVRIIQVNDLPT